MRASSSSDSSLAISSPSSTPQWPCEVYSQRQTSVSSTSSGKRGRSSRKRALHDPVLVPGAAALVVLLLRDAEQDQRLRRRARRLVDLAHEPVDGVAGHARKGLVRLGLRRDEVRHARSRRGSRRVSRDERAQARRAPKAPQPGHGERAHGSNLSPTGTGASGTSSSTSTGTAPPPCHGSSRTRSAKNSQIARRAASVGSARKTPGSP